jgi:hypothetical protein
VILVWPVVAVVGFVVLAALVIALATSSTAQYEFERNRVQSQRQPAAVPATVGAVASAGQRAAEQQPQPGGTTVQPNGVEQAVGGSPAHPAGKASGPHRTPPAWWLVDEDESGGRAVDGPFHDRIEAEWAALADGRSRRAVYGALRPDGGVVRRQSPEERAWLSDLSDQLDRLPEEWDGPLADEDELVTLVVEVASALVEAGLSLHDCAGAGSSGGVCLTPEPSRPGVLVSWHQHDRMGSQQVHGPTVGEALQRTRNAAIVECLQQLGFDVEPYGSTGCCLVSVGEDLG